MAALTQDRNTPRREGRRLSLPVAAGVVIYAGALVVVNASGYAQPGTTATGLKVAGRAEEQADNAGGSNGAILVTVDRGEAYQFENAGDVGQGNLLSTAYIVDDQTVSASDGGGTRSPAGTIIGVDSSGVWVEL